MMIHLKLTLSLHNMAPLILQEMVDDTRIKGMECINTTNSNAHRRNIKIRA